MQSANQAETSSFRHTGSIKAPKEPLANALNNIQNHKLRSAASKLNNHNSPWTVRPGGDGAPAADAAFQNVPLRHTTGNRVPILADRPSRHARNPKPDPEADPAGLYGTTAQLRCKENVLHAASKGLRLHEATVGVLPPFT